MSDHTPFNTVYENAYIVYSALHALDKTPINLDTALLADVILVNGREVGRETSLFPNSLTRYSFRRPCVSEALDFLVANQLASVDSEGNYTIVDASISNYFSIIEQEFHSELKAAASAFVNVYKGNSEDPLKSINQLVEICEDAELGLYRPVGSKAMLNNLLEHHKRDRLRLIAQRNWLCMLAHHLDRESLECICDVRLDTAMQAITKELKTMNVHDIEINSLLKFEDIEGDNGATRNTLSG